MEVLYIATDGACCKNGKNNSQAGWGIYINKNSYAYGPVPPTDLVLSRPISNPNSLQITKGNKKVSPTNNRGELLAIALSLLAIKENLLPKAKKYVIVSDSEYSINSIDKWLDSWVRKDLIKDRKNPDLLNIFVELKKLLKEKNIKIEYQHQRSHTKDKSHKSDRNKFEELNYQADKLASLGQNSPHSKIKFSQKW